jgi:hypothetical protein
MQGGGRAKGAYLVAWNESETESDARKGPSGRARRFVGTNRGAQKGAGLQPIGGARARALECGGWTTTRGGELRNSATNGSRPGSGGGRETVAL